MSNEKHMRLAIAVARRSESKGNLPFGCVLVDGEGKVLMKGENTIMTSGDALGHAEVNLIRKASKKFSYEFLNTCTIYTTDEPCPMCTSAIFWSGIKKLVFGMSKASFYDLMGRSNPNYVFEMPCRELFDKGGRKVEVVGPFLDEEVALLHSART
ncbi:nucleoside deaminase [Imperialibacter roseus]|uniref:Nucleoside deaminase n=1 Tax=Imperialibacter roseus TaxID=1324217 RepID=A0ABZ0IU25_9BACT|nr:nucleoside deaminase [Imperialibacter roseus]WOK07914.1 nucleoside deaminase [Imperialibacter roseus]